MFDPPKVMARAAIFVVNKTTSSLRIKCLSKMR